MGNRSRGRRLLLILLGLYLAGVAWLWVRYPAGDAEKRVIQIGLWGVLPTALAFFAAIGAAWARRGLAVVWGLHGTLQFFYAQNVSAHLAQGGKEATIEDAVTPAVVSIICMLAAVVVLVQKDIREMTRSW